MRIWASQGARASIGRISRKLAKKYTDDILAGTNPVVLKPITHTTMRLPVRLGKGGPSRGELNPSQFKPLKATGATARSIKSRRENRDEYSIGPTTDHGALILGANQRSKTYKMPGSKGKTVTRPARDVLQIKEVHIKLIEDEFIKELDKVLKGFF